MSKKLIGRVGGAMAALSLTMTAGTASASPAPASTPGWRLVAAVGSSTHNEMPGDLVATGPDDAFSSWHCASCSTSDRSANFVLHWNGRNWGKIALPVALNYPRLIVTTGASAATNLWAFASNDTVGTWNGSQWTVHPVPSWVLPLNHAGEPAGRALVLGPGNVWVFSESSIVAPSAAHFSGGSWHEMSLPADPIFLSAAGPSSIWGMFITTQSAATDHPVWKLMHWNGSAWRVMAPPKPSIPAGESVSYSMVATGSRSLWLVREIWSISTRRLASASLLRWDGSWQHVAKVPFPATGIGMLNQDGHGGVWMAATQGLPPSVRSYSYHYGGGAWTRQLIPDENGASLAMMTWIPGSRSLWATEWQSSTDTGYILKHGP